MGVCLSKEQILKAWEMERSGKSRRCVAMKFYVCERTLERMYKHYKLNSPKRK